MKNTKITGRSPPKNKKSRTRKQRRYVGLRGRKLILSQSFIVIKERKDVNMFKCSFCGKEFENAPDRARCEIECDKANHIKAEKERQNKLKAEKEKRIEELDKARVEYFETWTEAKEKYLKIVEQYNKDYGVTASCSYSNIYPSNYFQDIIDKMIYGK